MAQFPCLPLWTDAWVADLGHLSLAEEGVFIRLMIKMWRTPGCRVPNDDAWLAKHLHLTADELRDTLRPIIAELCQNDGNWITQKRLMREFVARFQYGGRMSALAKRRHRKTNGASTGRTAADAVLPSLPLAPKEKASFLGENQQPPSKENQPDPSASELATAPDEGALARSPPTQQDQPRTLAEINARWRPAGTRP